MLGNLTGIHAIIILAVVVLLFGATKLPALAKSVGQSMKIFRNEMKSGEAEDKADDKVSDKADDSQSTPKS